MARLHTIGFELNSATAGMEWTGNNGAPTISSSTFRSGLYAMRVQNPAGGVSAQHQYSASTQENIYARFYFRFEANPSATIGIAQFVNTALKSVQAGIRLTTTGTLQLYNFEDSAQVGSDSAALRTGIWYRIEIRQDTTTLATTAVEALLEGVSFASGTINLANGGGFFRWGSMAAATVDMFYDDVAINDSTGSAQTGYPGSGKVVYLRPTAAGDNAASAGLFSAIDETPPNDVTDFIDIDTAIAADYNVTDTAAAGIGPSDTIKLVQVGVRIREETSTTTSYQLRIKSASGGSLATSTASDIGSTTWRTNPNAGNDRQHHRLVSYTDPTTAAAWTPTGTNSIENMQIGVAMTTGTADFDVTAMWAAVEFTPAKFENYSDNFDDNSIDTAKHNVFGTGVTEANQRMELAQPVTSATYRGVTSDFLYDLEASYLLAQLLDAGNQSLASLEVYPVQCYITSSHKLFWLVSGNTIYAIKTIAGSNTTLYSVAYNSSTHQWFRIREESGTVYWDTHDGTSWTNRASETVANLFPVTAMVSEFVCGTYASEASGTTILLDNLNVAPAGATAVKDMISDGFIVFAR